MCRDSYLQSSPVFLDEGLVSQEVDVFGMVVGFVLSLCLLIRFSGVNSFHNAQLPASTA